ncbi:hypothetical protein [Nostoc sp.]|uniref:hypothetical protein n=1 Tax=Nostoc sp. TaxID=1180 RepID=UPI002FF6499B
MTDEDKMIYKLTVHRYFIGWVIDKLKEEGISAKRTTGGDRNGDIFIVRPEDAPRVKEIVRNIHNKYNS